MTRNRKPPRTAWALWADQWDTGIATLTTLAVRVPQLVSGTMSRAETQRMIAEKAAAAHDGIVAGSIAAGKLARRGPRRPTLARNLHDALAVWEAASAPARRTVAANAKRLTAGGKAPKRK